MSLPISVVVTTSPVPSNPSTDLLERVLKSFDLIPGLQRAPKIIVCDGYKIAAGKSNPKAGNLASTTWHIFLCLVWKVGGDMMVG